MSPERFKNHVEHSIHIEVELLEPYTEEEFNEGYHYCQDWDGLFISPNDPEWDCCGCHPLKNKTEEK